MAGELREENAETANIWGIQNEKKQTNKQTRKLPKDMVVQKQQKKKKDPIFCSRILPALAS